MPPSTTNDPAPHAGARPGGRSLVVAGVRARYGVREVLHGIDLVLEGGQVHGMVGLNGAGKTTLLDTMAGIIAPSAGTMSIGGTALSRNDVAYLPTELQFYPRLTGRDILGVYGAARASGAPAIDVDAWAEVFDVPLDALVDEYSAGMRRKLALIATVTLERPVLLLDEPANALDLEANALLGDLLRAVASRGVIVLVTSHILAALATCDAVHRIADGRIAGRYQPHEFPELVEHLMSSDLRERRARLGALAGELARPPASGGQESRVVDRAGS